MGIAERKTRQRAELREHILTTAREIVFRDGYEALTMRKIADAIEYSPATIYLYFESREEIGRQLVREGFDDLLSYMGSAATVADPVERVREIGRSYVRFGLERPEQYKLIFMTDPRYGAAIFEEPAADMSPDDPGARAFAFLVQTVQEAQATGHIAEHDPLLVAEALWCSVHGIVSMAVTCPGALTSPVPVLTETMLEIITRGLVRRA